MKFNINKAKKWGAFMLVGTIPALGMMTTFIFTFSFIYAALAYFITLPIVIFLGSRLTAHPYTSFIEGDGYVVEALDSTGVCENFIAQVRRPMIEGKLQGQPVNSIFDRAMIYYKKWRKEPLIIQEEGEEIVFRMKKGDYNKNIFSVNDMPHFKYNKQLNTFISKEQIANLEADTFVQHLVLYLVKRTEKLSEDISPFVRYVWEMTKPKTAFWDNPIVRMIAIGLVLIILAFFGYQFIVGMMGSNAGTSAGAAAAGAAAGIAEGNVIPH